MCYFNYISSHMVSKKSIYQNSVNKFLDSFVTIIITNVSSKKFKD
jgi:hypothetical protein